ncbi:P-loop containing nucleoside triphosphate hydrolase protein [Daldinia loculata]|uniref:P-loop containing nucleoside triphosphate hydrolase protein n=1 Tax=Daldinia loculata TaxID=103429 RepID=UPI0020C3EA4D|nr:P-loop containing nucleoside triphosphate hydrolase protein [Daldinia loculata]KAI1649374.1 P-loop containing nucleoside triphosphate hydrolase protein [Daldinia loculata]
MSRHQAYRNYDYENDLDEYEGDEFGDEEEELSSEDQAQMNVGTAQVRTALGVESSKVTTKQIQDALWHYYYDVDKSVTYLMTKYVAPSTKKKGGGEAHAQHVSFAGFFSDMPWLNIPKDRETTFIVPSQPRSGLLGGASTDGKVSKLQALAAARKKKAEDRKLDEKQLQDATQKLSNLSTTPTQPESSKENARPTATTPRGTTGFRSASIASISQRTESKSPNVVEDEVQGQPEKNSTGPTNPPAFANPLQPAVSFEAAAPSPFAQALLGSINGSINSVPRTYPFPYINLTSSVTDAFSAPSPDDVVLAAQSQASSKKIAATTTKKKASARGKVEEVTDGVKGLNIPETPLPKSKNVDVLKEFEKAKRKKNASFVVVGHVDAGKSTLMGRLLLDLNVVDQRTIQKYRKEAESIGKSSFALAWVLDQRSEERSRGVTIDIATNKFETENTSFTILDAPGHRDFIPNMIAGASQADFAILVVDATTGAFEAGLKGQTREHSLLLRSMGVSRVIVAINKLDTVGWSQERFDEISQQVSGFLSATGFQLKNVSFVPVSGLHGDNIVKRATDAAANWYCGKTLVEELESSEPMARALDKPLRLTISEVYRTAQSPLTISGRIDAGSVQVGDALMVQPSGEKAYVKSLELDREPVDWAVAGQNVVIHLSNIEPIHVRVGDIICDTKQPIDCIDTFTVKVLAFDILMPMQVDVHRGRLHAAGQILEIPALLDKTKGTVLKKKPKIVKPASVARVVVKMGTKVPLEAGQRVVLRSGGETVAAGLLE